MKIYLGAVLALLVFPAQAADDVPLTRMAACQDSWLDWNTKDPAKNAALAAHFRPLLALHGNDPYMVPKAKITFAGMNVSQVFPESIGMALGFSATVDAPFDKARTAVEKIAGKKLDHCEDSDGMQTCALQIAEKRTITVMAVDGQKPEQTLIGCYYYYEK